MNFKKIYLQILVVVIVLLQSCVPTKQNIQTSEINSERISNLNSIGVISDVCLMRDPIFLKDYIIRDESQLANTLMMDETYRYMKSKGYNVNLQFTPFVGSYFDNSIVFRYAKRSRWAVSNISPPFLVNDSIKEDSEYIQALIQVITTLKTKLACDEKNIPPPRTDVKNSLKIISNRTGRDEILFIIGEGRIVPVSKSIIQGIIVGTLTTILTMGMLTVAIYQISYMHSYLALIDLKQGEILWANSLLVNRKPTKKKYFVKRWSKKLLYYFPEQKDLIKQKAN